ncbi:molybdopterin-dependent oxidoreductase [Microbacterium sp. CPCC 204701]|uniref:molybdopterin-dependent oxidoreductase n=1 Tax=Microbacterium sp. CPCC 204701 TaxID=2493084 RepID=UPI001F0B924A|nr:molybdopterin-dependent oxidoreductase [Microbacterium sp. CPCC 204701]
MRRRVFLAGVGASTAALVALTAGQAFDVLAPVNLFAPRVKGQGPQALPVNRTAAQAGVTESAHDTSWRLEVRGAGARLAYTRDELAGMPQTEAVLPIACVEGWSTSAHWRGVRLRDLLAEAGMAQSGTIRIESLQSRGPYRETTMPPHVAWDPLTLVALEVNGGVLDLDHGYPARIIAPGRPGVLQTKWLATIEELPA